MSYERKWKNNVVAEVKPKETLAEVSEYPIKGIPDRGISKATAELLGIRSAISPEDGKTVIAHYFPYYNAKGKLTGYKKRDLTKNKSDLGHFTVVGELGVKSKMFGQHVAEANSRRKKSILLVEGEYDVASVLEAQIASVKGTQYESLIPFVVGLNCGTANAVEAVLSNESFIRQFDEIVLGFDNDFATAAERKKGIKRGLEATEAVAGALLPANLYTVDYGQFKDPSDYLQEDEAPALAKLCSFDKKKYTAEKIVRASDISFEDVIAPREAGIMVPEFPELMKKIRGFRTHELWVVTAPSGVGKSTATSICAGAFEAAGETVGMIYLEEQNKETLQRILAKKLKLNYLKFKNDPLGYAASQNISREQVRAAYDEIAEVDKVIMLGHFGSMPIDELMNKIKHIHLVEGSRYIVLDHLSMVISGEAIENERKELDMVMTHLAAFCAANDVCIIVVMHINRSGAAQFMPPKDLKEGESWWVRVTKEMLRGSASLEQLAWGILGLEPEIKADRSRGNVRWTVLKNRTWGDLGEADEFSVDENTWEVVLATQEVVGGY